MVILSLESQEHNHRAGDWASCTDKDVLRKKTSLAITTLNFAASILTILKTNGDYIHRLNGPVEAQYVSYEVKTELLISISMNSMLESVKVTSLST